MICQHSVYKDVDVRREEKDRPPPPPKKNPAATLTISFTTNWSNFRSFSTTTITASSGVSIFQRPSLPKIRHLSFLGKRLCTDTSGRGEIIKSPWAELKLHKSPENRIIFLLIHFIINSIAWQIVQSYATSIVLLQVTNFTICQKLIVVEQFTNKMTIDNKMMIKTIFLYWSSIDILKMWNWTENSLYEEN